MTGWLERIGMVHFSRRAHYILGDGFYLCRRSSLLYNFNDTEIAKKIWQ